MRIYLLEQAISFHSLWTYLFWVDWQFNQSTWGLFMGYSRVIWHFFWHVRVVIFFLYGWTTHQLGSSLGDSAWGINPCRWGMRLMCHVISHCGVSHFTNKHGGSTEIHEEWYFFSWKILHNKRLQSKGGKGVAKKWGTVVNPWMNRDLYVQLSLAIFHCSALFLFVKANVFFVFPLLSFFFFLFLFS